MTVMRKNLFRFFSLLLSALTVMGATSAPVSRRVQGPKLNPAVKVTTPPEKVRTKGVLQRPQPHHPGVKNVFATSAKSAALKVKSPYKAPLRADATNLPELYGSVIWSDDMSIGTSGGLYIIPTNSSQSFTRLFRYARATNGGVLLGDWYFTCEDLTNPWYGTTIIYTGYRMDTGSDDLWIDGAYYTYSMTYDATTSTVYGIANMGGQYALTKVNFDIQNERVSFEPVGSMEVPNPGIWNAIACDSKGDLWAIYSDCLDPATTDGEMVCIGSTLYKVDKNTAALTMVGDTGFESTYASDATFDLKTDRLLWTVFNAAQEGFLAEVDTTTGAASVIYAFPDNEEVCGLVIPLPEAENGAPSAATDVVANFTGSSLSGSVDFKIPTTLFDGSTATGEVTYTVTANSQVVATGSAVYGSEVTAPVTVQSAGLYTFEVVISNAAGPGPKVEVKAFVGADTPEATTVTASYADGVMTVTWLPVTASINGGYIDVEGMKYTVTRFPDNVVVADKISGTTFTENLAEPDHLIEYYYEVVAVSENLTSQAARSNNVTLGYVVPPFTATFEDTLDGFTAIDANGDGRTWEEHDGFARVIFNADMAMDDWLMSPGLKLEAGKLYVVSADLACLYAEYPERMEIKVGRSATVEGMTMTLLEPTVIDVKTDAPMEWAVNFVPEADGIYYFGFHGISDKDKYYLYVDNFAVSAPVVPDGPDAVTDLTVTPGLSGALTATVSFTTPSVTAGGNELTSLSKVELRRGTELIHTWTSPAVNTPLTYTDNLTEEGDYTYSVKAYSSEGPGPEVTASVYVGVDYPASVSGVTAYETDKVGEVTVTWNPVTTTVEGAPLDASVIRYQLCLLAGEMMVPVIAPTSATSVTYQALPEGNQRFMQYAVLAETDRGYSKVLNSSLSELIPVGTPYSGLTLSSAEDVENYIVATTGNGAASWSVYGNDLVPSQDGDNIMFAAMGKYENSYATLYTGLVSLEGIDNPALTYYTYNIDLGEGDPDLNEIVVGVKAKGEQEFVSVNAVVVSETGPVNHWNRIAVDLSEYAGKTIQVSFYTMLRTASYTIIDNIRIATLYGKDLAVTEIKAPERVTTGDNYTVDVTVSNVGSVTAEAFTVELYAGNELVATAAGNDLAAGFTENYEFNLTMAPDAIEPIKFTAKAVLPGDENADNDQSGSVTVTPVASTLPAATGLDAKVDGAAVKLTWTKPDFALIPADAVTDDFEDGIAFASFYGDWTFVDKDGVEVDGFNGIDVPNIVEGETKGSFWIWDAGSVGADNNTFNAHSGNKYLFALYRYDGGKSDEWAISPELNGTAQTITFYAKSYSSGYPEAIKVWYSTGSTDPADFIEVKTVDPVPSAWTLIDFEVPAGAKHFAINSCAVNSFMLMVDDVTYIPAGAPVSVFFEGYEVYRNGVIINDAAVETCEYTDANVVDGDVYDYTVVAVYNKGRSVSSNVATILYQSSGLDTVNAASVAIATTRNSIVVTGAEGMPVAVYAVDGKTLYSDQGHAKTVIPVNQGVYVVKAGQTIRKVIVR